MQWSLENLAYSGLLIAGKLNGKVPFKETQQKSLKIWISFSNFVNEQIYFDLQLSVLFPKIKMTNTTFFFQRVTYQPVLSSQGSHCKHLQLVAFL